MLVFSPFRAPETKESKELEFSEREYIIKNGGTIAVEDPKLVATKKDWERAKESVANSTFYYFDPKKSNN